MKQQKCNHLFSGKVIPGKQIGRKLGFATANIAFSDKEKCADGVYAGRVTTGGRLYGAMINVGHRPSVGGGERMLEAHLFDFDNDIYGEIVTVELIEYIRPEEKFSSLEDLRRKIEEDRNTILEILKNN